MTVYQTWEDFLDDEDEPLAASPEEDGSQVAGVNNDIPPEAFSSRARELLAERDRLAHELDILTGKATPDGDERIKIMYPVPVHTRDTRILERRMRRQDELLRTAKRRRIEERVAATREAAARAELDARAKRRRDLQQSILQRWRRQRKAMRLAKAAARARDARDELRRRERERRKLEQKLIAARLELTRAQAAQITSTRRSELERWERERTRRSELERTRRSELERWELDRPRRSELERRGLKRTRRSELERRELDRTRRSEATHIDPVTSSRMSVSSRTTASPFRCRSNDLSKKSNASKGEFRRRYNDRSNERDRSRRRLTSKPGTSDESARPQHLRKDTPFVSRRTRSKSDDRLSTDLPTAGTKDEVVRANTRDRKARERAHELAKARQTTEQQQERADEARRERARERAGERRREREREQRRWEARRERSR